MKYIRTFESITEDVRFTIKEDSGRYRIDMFVGDNNVGYALVKIKDDVFSKWNLNNEENYESISEGRCLYIIGISMTSGKGWGSNLVKYIESLANQYDCQYVALGSITDALGFWKKMGYEIYGIGEYYSMYKKI